MMKSCMKKKMKYLHPQTLSGWSAVMTREHCYYFLARSSGGAKRGQSTNRGTQTLERQIFSAEHEIILDMTGSKKVLWNSFLPSP